MIKNMVAIEYNLFMTMLKLLNDKLPSIAKEYNVKNIDIVLVKISAALGDDAGYVLAYDCDYRLLHSVVNYLNII